MIIKNIVIKTRENLGHTYYMVIGDADRFGKQEILFEGISLNECKYFLERENAYTKEAEKAFEEAYNLSLIKKYGKPKRNETGLYEYNVIYRYCDLESDVIEEEYEYILAKGDKSAIKEAKKLQKKYPGTYIELIQKDIDPKNEDIEEMITVYIDKLGEINY